MFILLHGESNIFYRALTCGILLSEFVTQLVNGVDGSRGEYLVPVPHSFLQSHREGSVGVLLVILKVHCGVVIG